MCCVVEVVMCRIWVPEQVIYTVVGLVDSPCIGVLNPRMVTNDDTECCWFVDLRNSPPHSTYNLIPLLVTGPSADLHRDDTRCLLLLLLLLHLFNYSGSVQPAISPGRQHQKWSTPWAAVSRAGDRISLVKLLVWQYNKWERTYVVTPCFRLAFGVWLMSDLGIIPLLIAHRDSSGFVPRKWVFARSLGGDAHTDTIWLF